MKHHYKTSRIMKSGSMKSNRIRNQDMSKRLSSILNTKALLPVLLMAFASTQAVADDLLIIKERSKGISLSDSDNNLSASETFSVASKGRVWAVKQDVNDSYNVICMNQSAESITLTQSTDSPWIQSESGSCSAKASNVFSCTNDQQQPALMCRTQTIAKQSSGGGGITDMTAVAMRSLDNSDDTFYRIANSVMEQHKLHFDLCQDMHGQHLKGGVSFVIQATGEVENVTVIDAGELATPQRSTDYGQCMAQAIELWRFPTLDYVYEMEYAFTN